MANVKITELTAATALAGTDVLPIVDVGADATKKVSVSDLLRNLPDGTASAPALAFADDQNTGVLSPGNNSLAFATSGTQRLVIDSSGDVGIGTSSPSFIADIEGSGTPLNLNSTNDEVKKIRFENSGTAVGFIGSSSTSPLRILDGSANELMRISSGKLAVGTTSPSAKLHVNSGTSNTCATFESTDAGAAINITDSNARSTIEQNGATLSIIADTDASDASSNIRLKVDNSTKLIVNSSGNVGIGTTNPTARLYVQNDQGGSNGRILLDANVSSGYDTQIDATDVGLEFTAKSNSRGFAFNTGSSPSEKVRITSSGNVGIGTTSPGFKLEVNSGTSDSVALFKSSDTTARIILRDNGSTSGGYVGVATEDMFFHTNGTEAMRIDSSGRLLVGHSSSRSSANALEPRFQMEGINVSTSTAAIVRNENGTNGPILALSKSRGTSTGSSTIVQNGDITGAIHFAGADGTDLNSFTAWIQSEVDGTPGSNDMPGRLTFYTTADGANSPTERMRIDSAGMVKIGTGSTVTPDGNADDFVIDKGAADTGLSILSTTTGRIYFGDAADHEAGSIRYVHSDNSMRFETSSSERMRIDSSGRLLVGLTSVAAAHTGKIVSRNDVDYTSTEFEDNATLLLQNEYNNNSAVLVFHSNDSGGSSGRAAIVGGTVANGKGKLGFYGSCINKDSSDGEDVTIDADGRLLVGTSSAPNGSHQDTNSTFETYKSSGHNMLRVQSDSLANGQYSMLRAHGNTSGGGSRQVFLGVYKHAAIVNPGPFMLLEAEDGADNYYWTDNSNKLRSSTNNSHIGTTSGSLVGTQTSDLRLKNVGANVSYGLAEVKQLQPKQYALKDDPDVNKLGFIAQEVESIIPEAVFDTLEELDGHQEGDRTKLGMEYVQLIPVLVNAIKELSTEVDTLKTKVAALEAQ